jgi:hypothetical protein
MPAKTKRASLSPEEARDLTLFILSQPDEFTADDIHQSYPFLTRNQIVNKVSRMYGEGLLDVVGRNPNNKMNQFLYISQSRPREDPEILIAPRGCSPMHALLLLLCYVDPDFETLTLRRTCSPYEMSYDSYQACEEAARQMRRAFQPPALILMHACRRQVPSQPRFNLQGIPTPDDPRGSGVF